ncbi:MAG: outer membrane protein assembly factor BamD [Candidatus Zixiibacteriota bacterium]|nr:MAG: outer membrane protein assembly factor BamD [candidate division Zixibacteria bacterium]
MKTKTFPLACLQITLLSFLLSLSCGPKTPKLVLDAEDQYALARREFDDGNWDKAVVELQKVVFNYPGAAFIDSAQYLLGMAYFNQEEYPSAILELNKLLVSYPTSRLADDAAFMVAKSDLEMSPGAELGQENTQKAVDGLRNFLDDYPESDRRDDAAELLTKARGKLAEKTYKNGYLYYRLGHYESALIYLEKVLNDYHDTGWAKDAQFQIAEVHFKEEKYDQAREKFEKFLQDFPDHKLAEKARKRLEKLENKLSVQK